MEANGEKRDVYLGSLSCPQPAVPPLAPACLCGLLQQSFDSEDINGPQDDDYNSDFDEG
jgi:hypothetical protein